MRKCTKKGWPKIIGSYETGHIDHMIQKGKLKKMLTFVFFNKEVVAEFSGPWQQMHNLTVLTGGMSNESWCRISGWVQVHKHSRMLCSSKNRSKTLRILKRFQNNPFNILLRQNSEQIKLEDVLSQTFVSKDLTVTNSGGSARAWFLPHAAECGLENQWGGENRNTEMPHVKLPIRRWLGKGGRVVLGGLWVWTKTFLLQCQKAKAGVKPCKSKI